MTTLQRFSLWIDGREPECSPSGQRHDSPREHYTADHTPRRRTLGGAAHIGHVIRHVIGQSRRQLLTIIVLAAAIMVLIWPGSALVLGLAAAALAALLMLGVFLLLVLRSRHRPR